MRPLEEYRTEIVDLLAENESMTTELIRLELVKFSHPRWCDPRSRRHLPPWAIVNVGGGQIIDG